MTRLEAYDENNKKKRIMPVTMADYSFQFQDNALRSMYATRRSMW